MAKKKEKKEEPTIHDLIEKIGKCSAGRVEKEELIRFAKVVFGIEEDEEWIDEEEEEKKDEGKKDEEDLTKKDEEVE